MTSRKRAQAKQRAEVKAPAVVVLGSNGVKNAVATRKSPGRPFTPGNPGRPKGAKNAVNREMILTARDAFKPIVDKFIEKATAHLIRCKNDDCEWCYKYGLTGLPYVYGKPVQQHELTEETLRVWAASIAARFAIPMEEALARVRATNQRLLAQTTPAPFPKVEDSA